MSQLTEGIHENITPEIYHADPAISRSDLLLMNPPARYRWEKANPSQESTKSLEFGTAFHTMMMEPELFDTRHVVSQYPDFRSKEAREWRDAQIAKGNTVVSKSDHDGLLGMGISARQHPSYGMLTKNARRELTVVTKHAGTGLMLKARPDIAPAGNALVDFKSARDASPAGFGKSVWEYSYHRQAAHYLDCWNAQSDKKKTEFIFFVVETEPPYLCSVYVTPHDLIEYGRKLNNAALYALAHCVKKNAWPGYSTEINEFDLPAWAIKELQASE